MRLALLLVILFVRRIASTLYSSSIASSHGALPSCLSIPSVLLFDSVSFFVRVLVTRVSCRFHVLPAGRVAWLGDVIVVLLELF